MQTDDPRELIRQAKEGDHEAFDKLYEMYLTPVYRYIFLRVSDRLAAEDLSQTVFLKVLESLKRFEPSDSPPLAYLFTVARNAVIDYRRRGKNAPAALDPEIAETLPDHKDLPRQELEKQESAEALSQALKKLTAEQEEAVILKFINGFKTAEIAELLEKSEGAVRQLQCRGLRALKKHLSNVN